MCGCGTVHLMIVPLSLLIVFVPYRLSLPITTTITITTTICFKIKVYIENGFWSSDSLIYSPKSKLRDAKTHPFFLVMEL